ncbi:MAG: TrkA family potassium uptake protein [Clostridia bacterium]|nr:TrkA family potassium uptake protein [Clostridia bacterium]
MTSMLVIGLGRFGRNLAVKLAQRNCEVMVIDSDEAAVNHIAPDVTNALVGDCMDETVIASLGVSNFDVCFMCIGDNFQSSLGITILLKDAGAKHVVAKTDSELHAKFLKKVGADEVVFPERDMGFRTAMRYSAAGAFDYIPLSDDYAIMEMATPREWLDKSPRDLQLRTKYGINIIGIKQGAHITPIIDAARVFSHDDHLIVAGANTDIQKLAKR